MRANVRAWIVIAAAHVLCAFALLSPGYVRPDSIATFAYLRSAVFDHDFAFFNEWVSAGLVRHGLTLFTEVTPTGALANHWGIGTSILSAPPYLIAHWIGGPADGFGGLYAVVLAWTNVAFAIGAMCIAWTFMRRDVSSGVASVALVAASIGTPLFWQTFRFSLGTHVAGALAIALILAALFSERKSGLAVGLATGLAIVVRIQHFVIIPAIVVVAIRDRRPVRWWIEAMLGGAIPIACQAVAWWAMYGTALGPLTRGGRLEGGTWTPFQSISLWNVLTSSYHGLFSWSPVVVLSIAGWIFSARSLDMRRRTVAITCILMFLCEWIANGTLDRYFWGGMSFGARRFADLAVPFAIGIAWCASAVSARLVTIAAAIASSWSLALMVAAHAGTLSLARYVSGADLLHAAIASETWSRAGRVPLHLAPVQQSLIAVVIVVVLGLIATRLNAIAWTVLMSIMLAIVIAVSIRTPQRALESARRLHIDIVASRRVGPLIDQRGLLADELAWKRATGRDARETEKELGAINAVLSQSVAAPSSTAPDRR
ncbi:MAG: hypothetical protein DMF59_03425 [Acidobacteria bacterium]|nr:MAG: hypothetical protein DMF59_03425 [Acidobacteriota bacterium]